MACLDTTFIIDLRGRGGAARRAAAEQKLAKLIRDGEAVLLTCFTIAELYVGVYLASDPAKERRSIADAVSQFGQISFTTPAYERFGEIVARRQQLGRPIGSMDALIAAVAVTAGHSLVTNNARDFEHVEGLIVETY